MEVPKNSKQEKWSEIAHSIEGITDGLGKEIEPEIKETVIALVALGFMTNASCGGHNDRALPYPWIDVGDVLDENERYQLLSQKMGNEEEGLLSTLTKEEEEEAENLQNAAAAENLFAQKRLQMLLDEFYLNQTGSNPVRIVIEPRGWNQSRLRSEGVPTGHPEEIKRKFSQQQVESILEDTREEMRKFTEFLKSKYFNE